MEKCVSALCPLVLFGHASSFCIQLPFVSSRLRAHMHIHTLFSVFFSFFLTSKGTEAFWGEMSSCLLSYKH